MSFLGTWSQEVLGGQETEVGAAGQQRGEVLPCGLAPWSAGAQPPFLGALGNGVEFSLQLPCPRMQGLGGVNTQTEGRAQDSPQLRIAGAGRHLDTRCGEA